MHFVKLRMKWSWEQNMCFSIWKFIFNHQRCGSRTAGWEPASMTRFFSSSYTVSYPETLWQGPAILLRISSRTDPTCSLLLLSPRWFLSPSHSKKIYGSYFRSWFALFLDFQSTLLPLFSFANSLIASVFRFKFPWVRLSWDHGWIMIVRISINVPFTRRCGKCGGIWRVVILLWGVQVSQRDFGPFRIPPSLEILTAFYGLHGQLALTASVTFLRYMRDMSEPAKLPYSCWTWGLGDPTFPLRHVRSQWGCRRHLQEGFVSAKISRAKYDLSVFQPIT